MTTRRARLIAIQALVVAALVTVVVVTLLRPEDDDPLFGIETPTENTEGVALEPGTHDRRERGLMSTDRDRREPAAPGGAGGVALGAAPAPTPMPSLPAGVGPDPSSPADDQYGDALARLGAKVD